MEIVVRKKFNCSEENKKVSNDFMQLTEEFKSFAKSRGHLIEDAEISMEEGRVYVSNIPSLLLHSFSLHMEKKGKQVQYEKSTILRVV